MHEDEFEPRLGRMRANGSKRTQKYLSMVVAAARRSGARSGIRNRRFDGSRIGRGASLARVLASGDRHRSEEHTSELQSLMRISYAVFCLKTKNNKHNSS